MTITAKNIGRINVWPTYDIAREADTEECKFVGQMTVWRTSDEARANISHEEEGGGGDQPDWVPENAVIHIDLVGGDPQGRAWVAGTGVVAVDTLLGSDANTEGMVEYDPENLTADGYCAVVPVGLIGAALTLVVDGTTAVVQTKQLSEEWNSTSIILKLMAADQQDALSFYYNPFANALGSESLGGSFAISLPDVLTVATGTTNKAAITITGSRGDLAYNGSTAGTAAVTGADRPPGNPFVAALTEVLTTLALQSITLYDPLPSTAGLSELSEV
jgi:hypothetical protein